jgi:UDP-N-acetylglucosamine 2-epimerase (non-hydrolysing)
MSEDFFRDLNIPKPDINLDVGSASHAQQTGKIMERFEPACLKYQPDWVVVTGDVNSTMACTLVASKLMIRVAHIEAGLRSFDRSMPEEINRLVTDALSDLLFTPSADADENLLREGISSEKIHRVGNIMIDTLVSNLEQTLSRRTYERWKVQKKVFVFVTLHRPCNVDQRQTLVPILEQLQRLSRFIPVVFPLHPRTRQRIVDFGLDSIVNFSSDDSTFIITDPLSYHDSICLAATARFVLTDSGGLQEETTYLGTPCLTLRPNTERPVTITEGTNKLTSIQSLWSDMWELFNGRQVQGKVPSLWDGRTAERIVKILLSDGKKE